MPQIDWTIQFSDVVLVGGGIFAFVKMFAGIRDTLRDLTKVIGSENPPSGVLGDVRHLTIEQQQHREWLIRAGLDKK